MGTHGLRFQACEDMEATLGIRAAKGCIQTRESPGLDNMMIVTVVVMVIHQRAQGRSLQGLDVCLPPKTSAIAHCQMSEGPE